MPVHRFWSQESLVISKIDSPGRCQRLDLFIKVISVLCSYLTDASTDNFYSIFVSLSYSNSSSQRAEEVEDRGMKIRNTFLGAPPRRNRRFEGGARFTLSTSRISVSCCLLSVGYQLSRNQPSTGNSCEKCKP